MSNPFLRDDDEELTTGNDLVDLHNAMDGFPITRTEAIIAKHSQTPPKDPILKEQIAKAYVDSHDQNKVAIAWPDVFADQILSLVANKVLGVVEDTIGQIGTGGLREEILSKLEAALRKLGIGGKS